jgi:hypothetical protein
MMSRHWSLQVEEVVSLEVQLFKKLKKQFIPAHTKQDPGAKLKYNNNERYYW